MPRTIYLLIAYDGSAFHGWQQQEGLRTVQGVLLDSIRRVVRHEIDLHASGRTDAGVHAAGQVAGFITTSKLPVDRLACAIGSRLPDDLAVLSAREVHPDFHATRSALSKLYRYRIHHSTTRPVSRLVHPFVYHCWKDLDTACMRRAAAHFVGEHDFKAMAGAGSQRLTTIRRVLRCDVERHFDEIRIDVEGSGFLYNQVRNMVGTLFVIGRGQKDPDEVPGILDSKDRANAGPTMPARGLCLQWVRYPSHLLAPPDQIANANPADRSYQACSSDEASVSTAPNDLS